MTELKILAIIGARSGSKGISHKNIKPLLGKPLFAWAAEAAQASRYKPRIIMSTDSAEYAKLAREQGIEVPFLRPAGLSGDSVPDFDYLYHAVEWLEAHEGWRPDIVLRLPPTSPLVTPEHIDECIRLLVEDSAADSSRTITKAGKHPYKLWKIEGDYIVPFLPESYIGVADAHNLPRQSFPEAYSHVSVIALKRDTLMEKRAMAGDRIRYVLVPKEQAIDIDGELDFALAEILLKHRAVAPEERETVLEWSRSVLGRALPLALNARRLFRQLPPAVKVQAKYVGKGHPVFVVAEIGNNHNGDFDLAMRSIKAAADAGADAVKFQKRDVETLLAKEMKEMPYINERSFGKTYAEHREKQELSEEQFKKLKEYSETLGVVFFATPFDKKSADVLERIGVHAYKIASFDVTNLPLLEYVAKKGKPILLSTGASTLEEIDKAVECIVTHNTLLILNHCTSLYPTPDNKIDLAMVRVLAERYKPLPVGYSGHEPDILPTVASIALGATTVERHFTLDKKMHGSDHHMSIEPQEFNRMVDDIRRMEVLLGSDEKKIYDDEVPIRHKHAKSIVVARPIKKGQRITLEDLTVKAPGYGINPMNMQALIGKIAAQDLDEDTVVPKEALTW